MRTSNAELLAEIDMLGDITRKDPDDLEVVKTITQLKDALHKYVDRHEGSLTSCRPQWLNDALAL